MEPLGNAAITGRMIAKLERRAPLNAAARSALAGLPFAVREYEAGRYIVREGAHLDQCTLLLEGFAFRQKITDDGERQIVSIHLPGDFFDLEGALLNFADHNVQALTRCKVATVPDSRILEIIDAFPLVARALWIDTLVDASVFREWVLNVGRRSAQQRIAHVLCEVFRRMQLAGLADSNRFEFPMTQEQLADCTGLTSVHVSRSLRALEDDGLIVRDKRWITIPDWDRMRDYADFSELYLHLDQTVESSEQ